MNDSGMYNEDTTYKGIQSPIEVTERTVVRFITRLSANTEGSAAKTTIRKSGLQRKCYRYTPPTFPIYSHSSLNMAVIVLNDPSWWPIINLNIGLSYWIVAAGVMVVYDWVLTLGQEIELIWIRYIGILYSVYVSRPTDWYRADSSSLTISAIVMEWMPFVSLTDAGCKSSV
ncbi:uncharacterized protein F5147DRAFT_660401 [Suillus discolor]|uniref:DUF6533 domain-containing protein n=1 Tax=Suillus discolor TaxID=1912936 RepID=A0A9P7ERS4_9AGAM|nr:uncharacterized protein F5147DRAFT_660401 [Suillus discolor]KAG2082740.1 hypothetical protein F5147DRAFT_660401 [Suillus discolor]